jgi:hypothetical protein
MGQAQIVPISEVSSLQGEQKSQIICTPYLTIPQEPVKEGHS